MNPLVYALGAPLACELVVDNAEKSLKQVREAMNEKKENNFVDFELLKNLTDAKIALERLIERLMRERCSSIELGGIKQISK